MHLPTHGLVLLFWLFALAACDEAPPAGWQAAERIEFSFEGEASGARLALNREGHGMVVWEQRTGLGPGRIHARAVEIDGAHGGIATLGHGSVAPNAPDIAINPKGHAAAVWTQGDGQGAQVWASLFHADNGWGPGQPVSDAPGGLTARPRVAINEAGEVAVVWMQFAEGVYRVQGRQFQPARGWSGVTRIDQAKRGAALPQVSIDARGRWLTVWHQHSALNTLEVWARTIDASGAPSLVGQLAQGPGALPALAQLGDGSTAVVWQRNSSLTGAVVVNRLAQEGGWSEPQTVADINQALMHEPTVSAWGAQNAVAAWMQTRAGRIEVWGSHIKDGQPDAPQPLYNSQHGAQRQARVGAGDHGNAVAMWTQQLGTERTLWSAVWTGGGTPGKAERLDASEAGAVAESALAVDARGNALALWTQGEEGRSRLWIRRLRMH